MNVEELTMKHKLTCRALFTRPIAELVLWYADLDLHVVGDSVTYRCPECSMKVTMPLAEFLECDSSQQLRCVDCRGYRDDRGEL